MRTFLSAVSFLVLAIVPAVAADYGSLPAGRGRDVMVRVCSQCHSPEVAAGRRMDQSGWRGLVDQMANNGAQASDAEFELITNYLAASFPAAGASASSAAVHVDSPGAEPSLAKTRPAEGLALPAKTKPISPNASPHYRSGAKPSHMSGAKLKTKHPSHS